MDHESHEYNCSLTISSEKICVNCLINLVAGQSMWRQKAEREIFAMAWSTRSTRSSRAPANSDQSLWIFHVKKMGTNSPQGKSKKGWGWDHLPTLINPFGYSTWTDWVQKIEKNSSHGKSKRLRFWAPTYSDQWRKKWVRKREQWMMVETMP